MRRPGGRADEERDTTSRSFEGPAMSRRSVIAAAAALSVAATAGAAHAAPGDPGVGSVVDVVAVTAVPGALTIAGVGTGLAAGLSNLTASQAPGTGFGSPLGGSVLAVTDARLSNAGWYVTATYSDGVLGTGVVGLGAENIKVASGSAAGGAAAGTALTASNGAADTDGYVPLTAPVTVATTGDNTGAGITTFNTSYKLQVPVRADNQALFAGTVTYTVASVR